MVEPPPAPWQLAADGLLWWHRARPAARSALPAELADRRTLPLSIGGLLRYRSTPVGPYSEVLGAPVLLLGGLGHLHIPFIAVDSADSLSGGRDNWALPKAPAAFDWAGDGVRAAGEDWSVTAVARSWGLRLPAAGRFVLEQVRPDGTMARAAGFGRGWVRPARIEVGRTGRLAPWLAPGRHPGFVLSRGTVQLKAAGQHR